MVLMNMQEFPVQRLPLLETLIGERFDVPELCAQGLFQLGYLAATGKKTAMGGPGNVEALALASQFGLENLVAKLGSSLEGAPVVIITVKE